MGRSWQRTNGPVWFARPRVSTGQHGLRVLCGVSVLAVLLTTGCGDGTGSTPSEGGSESAGEAQMGGAPGPEIDTRSSAGPDVGDRTQGDAGSIAASGGSDTPPDLYDGHPLPPTARRALHEDLRTARDAFYHPADGGGRAEVVEASETRAGELGRWHLRYTTGPEGIAEGGAIHFQVSPFWGWSDPQIERANAPGFTEVNCSRTDVELNVEAPPGQKLVLVRLAAGALHEGDTVDVIYGAGDVGAMADRFAEAREFFYFWVDGDGDGTRKLTAEDASVSIGAREPARLWLTLPSAVRPSTPIRLHIAVLDRMANRVRDYTGKVTLEVAEGLNAPAELEFTASDEGVLITHLDTDQEGIFRVRATSGDLSGTSNPVYVAPQVVPVFWADLHGHSTYSDGTATPEEFYTYARDVAALDVCALTDHDHFGMRKLDGEDALWQQLQDVTNEFHEPGRFVTLVGYEWTSWLWGHRHVLYPGSAAPIFSAIDDASDTPVDLWDRLREHGGLTMAHHPAAGEPIAVDWSFAPPEDLEPLVEVVSVHGVSESPDSPFPVRGAVAGSFAVDALRKGHRLGFVGSGDSHDGHPGLAHLASPSGCGGLAAFRARELTRQGVLDALRTRRTYATNGARIYLEFRLGVIPMGGVASMEAFGEGEDAEALKTFACKVIGTAPLRLLEVVRNGEILQRVELGDEDSAVEDFFRDPAMAAGHWYHLRVFQSDGGMAWTSPIWIEE